MVRIFMIVIVSAFLFSCDAVEDMSGMFDKSDMVQEYIKKESGYESKVGFNISNGQLIQMTVYFQSGEVNDVTVSELEKLALRAVANSFKLTPKTLNVTIQSFPDESEFQKEKNGEKRIGKPESFGTVKGQ